MKKKILAVTLAAAMVFGMVACGGESTNNEPTKGAEVTQTAAQPTEAQPTETPEPTSGPEELVFADNAVDFAKNMKLGWNLGNTLDATGGKGIKSENSWGQPTTTKEMIEFVKESGFTTIRIPVSWGNHMDENQKIDEEWMARVKEVVDYAINCGLYVILNSHHDNEFYYPSDEHYEESEKFVETVWTQIAEAFKDYDEQLIFESLNEPRLAGTAKEWWFSATDPEGVASIKCIVKLNQKFVDVVRASGGCNATRFLMVPSHAASVDNALNAAFSMPTDTIQNHLIVSVHAYSPYNFAMNENGYKDWDASKESELSFMKKLNTTFVQNGYGVVIGEFGCTNKDNLEARVAWADSFTRIAAENGLACVWWDNGGTKVGGENFGLLSRLMLTCYYPDILEAMLKNYK